MYIWLVGDYSCESFSIGKRVNSYGCSCSYGLTALRHLTINQPTMMMMITTKDDNYNNYNDDVQPGENNLSPMDPLGAEDGATWREDNQEDDHDAGLCHCRHQGAGHHRGIISHCSCQHRC